MPSLNIRETKIGMGRIIMRKVEHRRTRRKPGRREGGGEGGIILQQHIDMSR
jgi:hypothetical protein